MEVLLDVENIVFEFEFKVFVVVELVVEEVFVVVQLVVEEVEEFSNGFLIFLIGFMFIEFISLILEVEVEVLVEIFVVKFV